MSISIGIKKILSLFFYESGIVDRVLKNKANQHLVILMYHRILPKSEVNNCIQPGMYVTPEAFENHLKFLTKKFQPITLSNMYKLLHETNRRVNEKPICCLTFDDGWIDCYNYAFPILQDYGIPATVFLPTNYIGSNRSFWTDRLANLLLSRGGKNLQKPTDPIIQELEKLTGSYEYQLEKSIERLKKLKYKTIEQLLDELSGRWKVGEVTQNRTFISWKEVSEMRLSGLVSFGSHTVNHQILTTLDNNELQEELIQSKEKLLDENAVEASFIPFCYPNGNYNETIVDMVKKNGYSMAVTTQNGWNRYPQVDFFHLKRVGIHNDMASSQAMFGCRVANIF